MKIRNGVGLAQGMICISLSFILNLFIDITHSRATGQLAQGHRPFVWKGDAFFGGSSNDIFGLALLPDDRDEMSWFLDWFLSCDQPRLLTQGLCYGSLRDLCLQFRVKALSHDRKKCCQGKDLEVTSFALYVRRG